MVASSSTLSLRQRKTVPSCTGCNVSIIARERTMGSAAALHISQNSRSRSVSCAPASPLRTIQSVMRSTSVVFMGLMAPSTHAIPEMTSGAMSRGDRLERWHFAHATVGLHRAARIEMTAWRRVQCTGDLAPGLGLGRGGNEVEGVGNGCDQRARIGMARVLEDFLPAAL